MSLISNVLRLLLIPLFIGVIYITEKPIVRWTEDIRSYKAIHSTNEEIDLVTIGSSKAVYAVNAPVIQKEISKLTNENWAVYDLSRPFNGMDHHYVILKELLKNRKVKKVLIEYSKTSKENHPYFFLKAPISDLLGDFHNQTTLSYVERSSLILNQLFKRIAKRWEEKILKSFKSNSNKNSKFAINRVFDPHKAKRTKNSDQMRFYEKKYSNTFFNLRESWNLDSDEHVHSIKYLEKIIQLAEKHNTELIFVHYVGRYESILDEKFIKNFRTRFGVKLIQPKELIIRDWFSKDSYNDVRHMSVSGSKLFAKWLAPELIK